MNAVFDTPILIDYLNGSTKARLELNRFEQVTISLVSWMEVLVGASEADEPAVRQFLRRFSVYPVNEGVAERAVAIRRERRIRLPDAIVWGTAQQLGQVLVTRNSKDFPPSDPGVRIPYRI